MKPILIKNGRLIDPAQNLDSNKDLLIENGIISKIEKTLTYPDAHKIDAKGLIVSPGFIDMHCHLREPGYESSETIRTGTAAAAATPPSARQSAAQCQTQILQWTQKY